MKIVHNKGGDLISLSDARKGSQSETRNISNLYTKVLSTLRTKNAGGHCKVGGCSDQ